MSDALVFIRSWGLRRFAECLWCKLFYRTLRAIYGFHPWHASAPYACREYKRRIVALASEFRPASVADIGCGLGEVIVRIPAARRYGVDPSAAAIRVAKLLHGARADFFTAALEDTAAIRCGIPEQRLDLVILANWTHGCAIEKLRVQIRALHAVLPISAILLDTVRCGALPEPFFSHSLEDLSTIGEVSQTVDAGDGARDLHIIILPEYEGRA